MHAGWRILLTLALVVTAVGSLLLRDEPEVLRSSSVYAAVGLDPARPVYQSGNDNDEDDNGDADNIDADNFDADNEDADNDDGDDDDNENDDDDFDICALYAELGITPPPSLGCSRSSSAPARPAEPTCTTPGQDTVFRSYDDKVALRVFASNSMPVRVVIYQVINAETAPLPPGTFVRPLVYEVWASFCDSNPIPEFPAEVNLGIRYSDGEAAGLDERRFVIGRLDMDTATWIPVEKQANDPPANYVSATITQTGYYMVWEAPRDGSAAHERAGESSAPHEATRPTSEWHGRALSN